MRMAMSICAAGLALALSGCSQPEEAHTPVRPVLSVVVQKQPETPERFVGTIEARVSTAQAFRVGGTLVSRPVQLSDTVGAGQLIASLDSTTLSLSVQSAEADLATAQAQYGNAVAAVARLEALAQSDSASEANVEQARQQATSAQSAVLQAEARLEQAQQKYGYAQLLAAHEGVVTAVNADVGEVVAAGQVIATIARPDLRDLVIDVPDTFVSQVEIGDTFTVAAQLDASVEVTGQLREVSPQPDPVTKTWRLRIGLDELTRLMVVGTTATAKLAGDMDDQILLPQSAILTADGTTSVWVVDASAGTVSRTPVQAEPMEDGTMRILSGLEAGTRVVIAGVHSLEEGQQVRVDGEQG